MCSDVLQREDPLPFVGSLHYGITGMRGSNPMPKTESCTLTVFPTDHGLSSAHRFHVVDRFSYVQAVALTAYHCAYNKTTGASFNLPRRARVAIGGDYLPEVALTFAIVDVKRSSEQVEWGQRDGKDIVILLLADIRIGPSRWPHVTDFPKEQQQLYEEHIKMPSPIIGVKYPLDVFHGKTIASGYGRTDYTFAFADAGVEYTVGTMDPCVSDVYRNFLQCVAGSAVVDAGLPHVIDFTGQYKTTEGILHEAGTGKGR